MTDFYDIQECGKYNEKQKEMRASQAPGTQRQRVTAKKTAHYYKPTVEEFDDRFYLISSDVWLLGGGEPRKLSQDEVEALPIIFSWRGPGCHFRTDMKECTRLLCEIIRDMNIMQNPKFISFPLGKNIFCGQI